MYKLDDDTKAYLSISQLLINFSCFITDFFLNKSADLLGIFALVLKI